MNKQTKDHRYLQIADVLKQKIQQGTYQVGQQLPTEKVICDQYEVSRYTARSALRYLIDLQMIERKQGSGSVVIATEPPLMSNSFMQDLDDLWQYGNTFCPTILKFWIPPPPAVKNTPASTSSMK